MTTIKIDGQDYALESLSNKAKTQLRNLQVADTEIRRLNAQLAITRTARSTYADALKSELEQPSS